MTILESIILGFIQGITEFLPVSSSGHLWIFETLIFENEANIAFEVFLHFATLLAVLIFFREKIFSLLKNFFSKKGKKEEQIFSWKIIVSTITTIPVALFLKPYVEENITTQIVTGTLFLTGFFVLISEYFSPKKEKEFSWKTALFLGIFQGIAVIPGISRSGITIVFLLLTGVRKKSAVEISFLLSIPMILGAFIFLLPDLKNSSFEVLPLLIGGVIAFFAAILSIWGMMHYIERYWKYFAVWCFGVGGVVLYFV